MQRLLPPHLFAILLTATIAVGLALPIAGPLPIFVRVLGVPLAVAGLALNLGGAGLFDRIGTNIQTFRDPDRLVTEGPFRITRNPMYLGFTLMLVAAAVLVGSLSAAVGPAGFFAAAHRWYIPFEERRMEATFGAAFDDYRKRVPRWVGPVRP